MILFVGQVGTDMRGREAFQEIDYRAAFGPLAKWATEIDSADRIPEIVGRAWSAALSGRPGPVVIALPEDMLTSVSTARPISRSPDIREPAPDAGTLEEIGAALRQSQKPLILMGGGGWRDEGSRALETFAARAEIPVLAAFRYQDRFDNHLPCFAGEAGVGMLPHVARLIEESDLVLAIGIRFGEMTTNAYGALEVPETRQTLIHVHPSDRELGKIYRPDIAVHAGPNAFSKALSVIEINGTSGDWRRAARKAYEAAFDLPPQPEGVDMGEVISWLRDRLPTDAILTNGAGNFSTWSNKFFRFGRDQRLLAPQSGAMGYGLPAAIAAKVAEPSRRVVCFAGDGDLQMTIQELGTAVQENAAPIVLVLNNGSYGTIRMHQERHYPDRVSATALQNPDFVALARAYGLFAERVETTDAFAGAFARAEASQTGAVLDLNVSVEAITPKQTLSQIRGSDPRI